MCGFFVIKKKTNKFKVSRALFTESCDLIDHRGPDDKHNLFTKNISMGFRRLSIIDLSKNGRQPMVGKSNKTIMVFNGEIYNANKLKKKLGGNNFKSNSDTEVLLKLYETYGEKCLNMIKGMFSFIVYNDNDDSIFVARDQFGIKPLYYYEKEDYIIFSSEIKPILNYIKKLEINYDTLAEYFLLGKQDHYDKTFFKDIKSIEPAHYYKFKNQKKYKKRYWSIYDQNQKKLSEKDSIDHLSNILNETIDKYLISDRKIGTFLSSGIDSTSLTSIIAKKVDYKLNTFTYDFKNNFNLGEAPQVKKNLKKLNVTNETFLLDSDFVLKNFDKMCRILESPFSSIRHFAVYGLYQLAKSSGYKVIIEGAGGDEMLGGYASSNLPYILDKYKSKNKIVEEIFKIANKSSKGFETEILNVIMTLTHQGGSSTDATPFVDINSFDRGFLDNVTSEKFYFLRKSNYKDFKQMNNLQKSQIFEIQDHRLPRNLKYTDRLSMSNGVETRLPFLDITLAKYCFNLSNDLKLKNNTNRWIMKQVLKKYQQKIKFSKSKRFIVDPQKKWLQNDMKEYLMDNLSSKDFKDLNIFNQKYILEKIENYFKDESPETSFQYMQILSSFKFIQNFK
jgi:asparagine synthase (glutamine-hydrolysing)